VVPLKPSKKTIIKYLNDAENEFGLKKDTLVELYEEEARVVFMVRRHGITSSIRKILQNSLVGEKNDSE